MCGIAGFVGRVSLAPDRIAATLSLMGRRGPDHAAEKHLINAAGVHIHLLHALLNIIDLDARANQPFQLGPITLVFNGEIYNYVEVRDTLARAGRSFSTSSDTEVL